MIENEDAPFHPRKMFPSDEAYFNDLAVQEQLGQFVPDRTPINLTPEEQRVVASFRNVMNGVNATQGNKASVVTWFGFPLAKHPADILSYQEIFFETRPTVLIECGTCYGGSALFFAQMFDSYDAGRVLTIDINTRKNLPAHPRITYVTASSTESQLAAATRDVIGPEERVMVVLDSEHTVAHVSAEIALWAPLVTPGCYMVVEDTTAIYDLPASLEQGHPMGGPAEAVRRFLATTDEFAVDGHRDRFMCGTNPGGWLYRRPKQ